MVAASGSVPPVSALESVMMSGTISASWQANIGPMRPNPVMISSRISRQSASSHAWRRKRSTSGS